MSLGYHILYLFYSMIIVVSMLLWFNPANYTTQAQAVILQEYVKAYCYPDERFDKNYLIGQTAVLSRLTIKAGIGEIALAEYVKCRVQK